MPSPDNYNLEEDDKKKSEFDFSLLFLILRLLISPVYIWKQIKRMHIPSQKFNCFTLFPIIGLAGLSKFINSFFWNHGGIQNAVPKAIETICSFFFGYFIILILGKLLLPPPHSLTMDTDYGKNFISANLSTLALFESAYQLFPILQPILVFLPVWTVYIISRGVRFLTRDQETQTKTTTILSVLIVGVPLGMTWLFGVFF